MINQVISMTVEEFSQLSKYVKRKFGINLLPEKKALAESRLNKLIHDRGYSTVREYYEYVKNDVTGRADIELINAISTNHTFFMRESAHFSYFADRVLPEWYQQIQDRDLRVWCAACSSGEEAYTLAILIREFFMMHNTAGWDTSLLATDISEHVLGMARQGSYTNDSVAALPERWRRAYFHQQPSGDWNVDEQLKQAVIFRRFNLMSKTFPFKRKFHAIFCRNVMIYFDQQERTRLARQFYDALEPGGYLFIGHSEVVERKESLFHYVMPAVYRK